MKKTTAAVREAAPPDIGVRELKAQAVQRALARKRPPKYRTAVGAGPLGTDLRVQVNAHMSELLPVTTVAEWCDEQMARLPMCEPYSLAIRILDALRRDGPDAAAGTVRLARELGPWNQWILYVYLSTRPLPPSLPPGADLALQPITNEWQRQGLVTDRSEAERQRIPIRTLNADSLAIVNRPRPAIPAGMKI